MHLPNSRYISLSNRVRSMGISQGGELAILENNVYLVALGEFKLGKILKSMSMPLFREQ